MVNYLVLFSLNTLRVGIFILILRFRIRVFVGLYSISWFSLIFFIIYIGGLLVLFIYVSSLNNKPIFRGKKVDSIKVKLFAVPFLLLVRCLNIRKVNNSHRFFEGKFKDFRLNLFKKKEILLLFSVGLVLLLVLWVIRKVTFSSRGAFRPTSES